MSQNPCISQNNIQHSADNVIKCCFKKENENVTQEKSYKKKTVMELEEDNSLKAKSS